MQWIREVAVIKLDTQRDYIEKVNYHNTTSRIPKKL